MKFTKDLWFSSYLLMENIPLASFSKDGGRLTLYFDLTEEEWADHRLKFSKSSVAACKATQEKLKDLLY
jgi:hypothetical protein